LELAVFATCLRDAKCYPNDVTVTERIYADNIAKSIVKIGYKDEGDDFHMPVFVARRRIGWASPQDTNCGRGHPARGGGAAV
jgi:hypothetical protein